MKSGKNSQRKKLPLIVTLILFIFSAFVICSQRTEENPQSLSENETGKAFHIFRIGSHIFAKVTLNGDEKYWVIDTGAGSTVIDAGYAKRLMIPELGKGRAMGASGPVDVSIYNVPKILINNNSVENINMIGFDVYGLFKKKYNIEVVGILGFSFLSKYVARVDYAEMTMTLFDPSTFKYEGTGHKINFLLQNNIIILPMKVDNKYDGIFMLDTGASTSAFNYPYAVKNKITEMDGPDYMARGAQGSFRLNLVRFPNVEFGGYILNNIVMSYPVEKISGALGSEAFTGNIGINILQNFLLYIDYKNKILYLEKSPNFNREFPIDKSGMQMEFNENNEYKINYISKNSAALKAGLKVGDIILTINGKKPADIGGIDEIRSIFEDKIDTTVDIKIKRDKKESNIQIVLADPFKTE